MSDDDHTMRLTDPLRELGKQLPYDRPSADRRDALRSSLLVAASEGERPGGRRRWLLVGGGFAAGALAAAAVAIVVLRPAPVSAPTSENTYARIESSSAAELERTTVPTATGRDELVRVRSGTVRLAVPSTRAGDHVRLRTSDAEVEGTGAYEVVVTADALASVTVSAGTATVRVKKQQAVFLAAGETWRATVVTAELPAPQPSQALGARAEEVPAPVVTPAPVATRTPAETTPSKVATPDTRIPVTPTATTPSTVATRTPTATKTSKVATTPAAPTTVATRTPTATKTSKVSTPPAAPTSNDTKPPPVADVAPRITDVPSPAVTAPTPAKDISVTERRFRAGWALLRANKNSEAAVELGAAADGDGPLAIDARYFQAVALIRAGKGPAAERALVSFLDHAPTSTRRGRASIMLARLLVERGEKQAARAWFETALRDSDPSVSGAAQAGLDSLSR